MFEILFPAFLTGILLSLITAPLGVFVVWRKMAYFGDTLSHSALFGVALGIFFSSKSLYHNHYTYPHSRHCNGMVRKQYTIFY